MGIAGSPRHGADTVNDGLESFSVTVEESELEVIASARDEVGTAKVNAAAIIRSAAANFVIFIWYLFCRGGCRY